ncbi:hypothetical protein AOLI_G00187700 [Acnodon oligacanthus]
MSCIQKNPETDGSSCPIEEEAILQHKPSDAGDDLEQAEPSVSCILKKPETDWSSCPVEEEFSSQHKPLNAGGVLV